MSGLQLDLLNESMSMKRVQLLIHGESADATGAAIFERRNPLDDCTASVAAAASPSDCKAAVDAAAKAFPAWSAASPAQRRSILLKAAHELEARSSDFIDAMARETGASRLWAGFNVHLGVDMLLEAGSLTTQISGDLIPADTPGSLALAVRSPAGVVLGIAPWNAPIALGVRAIAVPLACGNTVVFKGSEQCPQTHRLIVDALQAAGLPPGVLNFVTNAPQQAPEVVEALIAHQAVRRVNFTGSTHVGRKIAVMCAQHLKPAVLELGGKAPLLVLDDADLDAAVAAASFGAFANSGQICMSTERIVVDERVADEFVVKLGEKARGLVAADPRHAEGPPWPMGAVIGHATVERCNALIDDALAKGAKLVCGGKGDSLMMGATLLDPVRPDMRIYSEESFGPVKPIVRVKGEEAAIACANDNAYGLSAAVFSRDIARAWRVAQRIESGMCHINGPTVQDEPQMPFGGVKASGYGRFGGKAGIDAFTELRWITVQTQTRHYPF
jgi:benzaldehyde dehydrogenase (NAD)